MNAVTQKVCIGCGKDVSTVKRVRDDSGRYFCQPCYETALAGVSSGTLQPAVPKLSDGIDVPAKPSPTLRSPQADSSASSSMETGGRSKARGKKTSLLRLLGMLVVAVAATTAALYLFVLRPQNERITETADAAMKQSEANAQKSRELSAIQERVAKRRELALNAVGGGPGAFKAFSDDVTDGGKRSMVAALDADPILTSVSRDRSDVRPLLLSFDADALIAGLDAKGTAALSKPDQVYLIQLATVIHTSCTDSGPPPAPVTAGGNVTGDVWVKKTTGEVIPIAAFEVLLLPPTLNVPVGEPHIADAIRAFQIHVDVAQKYPNDAGSQADAKQAAATIADIDPSQHSNRLAATSIISASKTLIDIDAASLRIFEAAGRVKQFQIDSLERKIKSETLWQFVVQNAATKVKTDRDGRFRFSNVKSGEYIVACRAFLPASQAVVYWGEPITVQSGREASTSLSADRGVVVGY